MLTIDDLIDFEQDTDTVLFEIASWIAILKNQHIWFGLNIPEVETKVLLSELENKMLEIIG